ncbi:MAG: alpha/beta fold hydrolase [Chloroflexi bacterium]|nr:alpha/beta fold hydrolase [Chloroflexota bacterium]
MTILGNRYSGQVYRATLLHLADLHLNLLKKLWALFVACVGLGLLGSLFWLALARSPYLTLASFALASVFVAVPLLATFPLVRPRRTRSEFTPTDLDIDDWQDVRFFATDGVELSGWFIPPDSRSNGATLVYVHGLGGNRGELLTQAAVMIARGYGALLFDLRNHGASAGTISTLGYREADDVSGAVKYLLTRPEVNVERIGLVGYSMGGAAVLRAAVRMPQVKAIVVESSYTSIEENVARGLVAKTGLPAFPFAPLIIWLGEQWTGLRIKQVRPIDDVARITRPILFVHGAQDSTIAADNSRRLYDAAQGPKGLFLIPNAKHKGLLAADPVGFERYITGFFDRNLVQV